MSTSTTEAPLSEVDRRPTTLEEFAKGWPVLLTAVLGSAFGIGGLATYPTPFFMPAFEAEFGWNRADVGFVASFVTLGVFMVAPWAGRLCDKLGVHRVTPVSIVLFALGYALMTQVGGSIWTLYAVGFLLAVAGTGTIGVCYSRAINTWFDKGRGLALGIMAGGTGIAAFILPLILPPVIEAYGWRAGYLALAACVLAVLPLALLYLKEQPRPASQAERPHMGLSFARIRQKRQFWAMMFGGLLINIAVSGATLHFIPMFTDLGGDRADIEKIASFYGLTLIAGRVIAGQLLDRIPGSIVAGTLLAIPAAVVLLPGLFGPAIAPLFAIAVGVALATETDLLAFLTSRYFGLKSFSQAYGWIYSIGALGFVGGPLLAGFGFNVFGDYSLVRVAWFLLFTGGLILMATLGRYPTPAQLEAEEAGA